MKKLVLLAGLHKTGTTSIQKTLVANLQSLTDAGFLFPRLSNKLPDGSINRDENQSRLLSPMFNSKWIRRGGDPLQWAGRVQAFQESLQSSVRSSLVASDQNALFVAEECSRFTVDQLLDLKGFFNDLNYEVHVFCFIRRPMPWMNSMADQAIAGRRSARATIPAVIRNFATFGLVRPAIKNVMQAFPDTRFLSFDAAVAHDAGPVGFFLGNAGIDLGRAPRIVRANEGRSDHCVRLNASINETVRPRGPSGNNDLFYDTLYTRYPALLEIPGKKFHLRAGEAAAVRPILEQENQWLKETFGEGYYDQELHFSDEPVTLGAAERQFLVRLLASADEPIKNVVEKYLTEH